jgi:Flp pilus assembly protein TadG
VNQACQPKSSAAMARNLLPSIRRLAEDDRGAVLVYVTVILAALFGIGALVVDIGRLASTQTELQSFADHLALAVAGELDGNANAITRADTVLARSEWQDRQTFANGGHELTNADVTARYLSGLPADDKTSVNGFVTTNPLLARYVEVTVTPYTVSNWLTGVLNALTGGALPPTSTATATAVAGLNQYVCDITPLMICSPNGSNYTLVPGRMIHLKSGGQGAAWGPGDFGLLDLNFDPSGSCGNPNTGANYFRCVLSASASITQCFAKRGVDIRPGQMTGAAAAGFNTRLDMYNNSLSSKNTDPLFAPAPNVIKGYKTPANGCVGNNPTPSTNTQKMPHDDCFGAGDLCNGSRFGTGAWSVGKAAYMATNYGGTWSSSATTRYGLYKDEIAKGGGDTSTSRILPSGRDETGRRTCSTQPAAASWRRELIAAVIDCQANSISGNASNVPVLKFVRLFLTEPASDGGGTNNADVWVEEIEEVEVSGGGAGFAHDVVQLYR